MPTSGDTVTTRAATSGASRSRSTQKRPNACWVDSRPRCSRPSVGGTAGGSTIRTGSRSSRAAAAVHSSASGEPGSKPAHGSSGSVPSACGQLRELLGRQQRRVVGGMALGRQPPALDRVGEDDARPVAHRVGLAEAFDQRAEVVAAEVAEGGQQVGVVAGEDADLEPAPQILRVGPQEPLVLLVGHRVDAGAQLGQPLQPRPVLDHLHVPAGRLEHAGQAAGRDVRHHAVERLAVEVDHPHDLAELGHHRVGHRLPDRALVELGVADQRDLAAADRDVEVPGHVAVGERAPHRRGRADADRPGRVVDRVGVLGPRRVRLEPAELAQRASGTHGRAGPAGS